MRRPQVYKTNIKDESVVKVWEGKEALDIQKVSQRKCVLYLK